MINQDAMQLHSRLDIFKKIIAGVLCSDFLGNPLELEQGMCLGMELLQEILKNKSAVYLIGNGGSAAVASHAQIDFLNVAKLRAQVLHEPSVITCMSNDYGYEHAYSRVLETMLRPNDLLIAISSSGKSKNIHQGVNKAMELGAKVITLSGFAGDNPLRHLGHLNYWLDSTDYGFVEIGHQFILHNLSDRFGVMGATS
jgi:D-sedoheptulose 7-phosphate isomerase